MEVPVAGRISRVVAFWPSRCPAGSLPWNRWQSIASGAASAASTCSIRLRVPPLRSNPGRVPAVRRAGVPPPDTPDDSCRAGLSSADRAIRLVSQYSAAEKPDPIVCNFDTARCHTTLLGLLQTAAACLAGHLASPRRMARSASPVPGPGIRIGRRLRESRVSGRNRRHAACGISARSRHDLPVGRRYRQRSTFRRFPAELAERAAIESQPPRAFEPHRQRHLRVLLLRVCRHRPAYAAAGGKPHRDGRDATEPRTGSGRDQDLRHAGLRRFPRGYCRYLSFLDHRRLRLHAWQQGPALARKELRGHPTLGRQNAGHRPAGQRPDQIRFRQRKFRLLERGAARETAFELVGHDRLRP